MTFIVSTNGLRVAATWNSRGDWLFFSYGDQLLAYRPGDDSARTVAIELDGPYYGMAAR